MLGFDLGKLAKEELAKVDAKVEAELHKLHLPSLPEIEKEIEAGVAGLQALEAKVTPAEVAAALNILFPGKFTAEEVVAGEAALGKVLAGLSHLQAAAAAAQKVL